MSIKKTKYAFPKIPVKFWYKGDIDRCKELKGYARQQLAKLLEIDAPNRYNKYLVDNRRWPVIKTQYGELISIQMLRGVALVIIYAPKESHENKKIIEQRECFCDCAITIGAIMYSPARDSEDSDKWLPKSTVKYRGNLCDGHGFKRNNNLKGLDFYPHRDNEPEIIDAQLVSTKRRDIIYGLINEKDIREFDQVTETFKLVHKRLPDINSCKWKTFVIPSIEPMDKHKKKKITLFEIDDNY